MSKTPATAGVLLANVESRVKPKCGTTSAFDSSSALANAVSWENELYGVEYDPLFLCGQLFTAPPDDVLRLSLTATAQNATDGLRETCVQIVVYPVDADGNIIGLPQWVNQN